MSNKKYKQGMSGYGLVVAILIIIGGAGNAEAGLSCARITSLLMPCLGYLNRGGVPAGACCAGVRTVLNASRSRADRQGACSCLKSQSRRYHVRRAYAQNLARSCRLRLPVAPSVIGPNIDCSKIA